MKHRALVLISIFHYLRIKCRLSRPRRVPIGVEVSLREDIQHSWSFFDKKRDTHGPPDAAYASGLGLGTLAFAARRAVSGGE